MVLKLIPDFGVEQLIGKSVGKGFGMDKEAADNQVNLVVEAHNALEASGDALVRLAESQTTSMWTADGKSVPLASELTARYNAAIKWREAIQMELNLAAEKLRLAIKETTELDDNAQAWYLSRLDHVFGEAATEGSETSGEA